MKTLLVLFTLLLVSLPSFGQTEKPQTIIVPTGSLGDISELRKKMLEKTLESKLDNYFAIVPKDLFEEAQEKAFEELDYEECTEEQCIMMIKEMLQVENSFQLVLITEEGDTQISLTWNDLDQKRVEEEYCEGCKTKQLRESVASLVEKLVVKSDVKEEPSKKLETVVDEKSNVVPNLVQKIDEKIIKTKILNKTDHVSIYNNMEIYTLCPQGDHNWYQSIKDEDCSGGGVKYVGEAKFNGSLIHHKHGKVKMMKPHGNGKVYYDNNNKIMFEGIWSQGKKMNVKYYSQDSGKLLGSYINGFFEKLSNQIPKKVKKSIVSDISKNKILFRRKRGSFWGWFLDGNEKTDRKYVGEIMNGFPNGEGVLTNIYGHKFEGGWKDGKYHGHGKETFYDGRMNEGEFKDGKKWNIIEYDKNGEIIQRWVNGVKQ